MKNKPILVVAGEPKSIFFEIFFKSLKSNNFKSPIILIALKNISKKILLGSPATKIIGLFFIN